MSTDRRDRTIDVERETPIGPGLPRLLALGCVLVLTASYVSVLRDVTRVVGGTETLFLLVGAMLVAATVLARVIRPRTATAGALVAAVAGFAYYLSTAGIAIETVVSVLGDLVGDTVVLATGLPLLRVIAADVWAIGFVPAPVFLSWYLALRGRYDLAVVPGGIALFFLILTGDAGSSVALIGTLAALGAIGFGELERRGNSIAQADLLAIVFAAIIVLSLTVSFVPSESTNPTFDTQSDPGTLEGTIDYAGDRSGISGSVDLSPEVRFTVESDRPSYWRTGIYDRFTGDEWVRTGQDRTYDGDLDAPPGRHGTVQQRVTAETQLGVMPTAAEPIAAERRAGGSIEVSAHGQIRPESPLAEGESYLVESAVLDPDPAELQTAGTDYPDHISTYLQTPESTSSAFEARTADVTRDADTPYETATAIERHLRTSKAYSLDVDRPDGNVAEVFLFEMDAGYCVYFATTMVQMLRAEDVPARYVTGYTSGEQVGENTHVVRGLDAHAWVEVYFPDIGWVTFEPTPGDAREDIHTDRLEEARASGEENIEASEAFADGDRDEEDDTSTEPTDPAQNETDTDEESAANETDSPENGSADRSTDDGFEPASTETDDGSMPSIPITRELMTIGLMILVGLVAGARRTGATARTRGRLGVYWQRRGDDPNEDIRIATHRLERLLGRRYRPRRRSESRRQYLETLATEHELDPRTRQVCTAYERATYGDGVDRETATETIAIVDELARDRLPIVGGR